MLRLLVLMLAIVATPSFAAEGHNSDHEFDAGSRISVSTLTPSQVENLATLGKVWGFLKYHHPAITSGQRQWDYDLLRVLPDVLAASNRTATNSILLRWVKQLGPMAACNPCATLASNDVYLRPALAWLNDDKLLGSELGASLRQVYLHRPATGAQFYLTMQANIGNPLFQNENNYKEIKFPDAGFQLLALFRMWNIVEYWAPYRDVIGENWDTVLLQSIAPIAIAKDRTAVELGMIALVARINDTHTNLWSSLSSRPPGGNCHLPVKIRFIENKAVVTALVDGNESAASGLQVGDVIQSLDDIPVSQLVQSWAPYYAASNEPTRLRDIARSLGSGSCGDAKIRLRRPSGEADIVARRVAVAGLRRQLTNDRAGEAFQRLSDDVAYLKLSSIKNADIARYMESAAGTRGLIIDIRNYPSEFVVFTLAPYFIEQPTDFVRFTVGDLSNPGAFRWGPTVTLRPQPGRHYPGKVMILVDEVSQSQAEYTTMALRASPRAKVIGSTTAGADGNVSAIPLPGRLSSMISGIGVFYPDKRPTQRVGIVPDIEVKPTLEGIRSGRDELLDAAIAEIRK